MCVFLGDSAELSGDRAAEYALNFFDFVGGEAGDVGDDVRKAVKDFTQKLYD